MPIIHTVGDVLSGPEKIVAHGCNCRGAYGAGVAGAISRKYPAARKVYMDHFKGGHLCLGNIQIVKCAEFLSDPPNTKYIVNMFTQQFYGGDGQRYVSYPAITSCFNKLRQWVEGLASTYQTCIAIPYIGAGLAGGDWNIIFEKIEHVWKDCNIPLYVYRFPQKDKS